MRHALLVSSQSYLTLTLIRLSFRDWTPVGDHVKDSVYNPIITTLQERLTPRDPALPPSVLVPGAGLCRLSWELTGAGYAVEANEYSPLFVTVAEALLNRAESTQKLCPLAHLFSENYSFENQFFESSVPTPLPRGSLNADDSLRTIDLRVGDFVDCYKAGGPGHRVVDAVVTCFFVDTCVDIIEYLEIIAGLLAPGGIWINLGPLNYIPSSRLKLNWDEVVAIADKLGLKAEFQTSKECAYSLESGIKMYAEMYNAVFFCARKV